jgi:hypothetical protein
MYVSGLSCGTKFIRYPSKKKVYPLSKFTEPVKKGNVELGAQAVLPQNFSTLTE